MFENSKFIQFPINDINYAQKYVPSPYIAKSFSVKNGLTKAILHIFGFSDAAYFLNGKAIPDSYRPTVPSTLEKTIVYNDYDLSSLLHDGVNRLGIMLGVFRRNCFGLPEEKAIDYTPFVILQLDLVYANGATETITSDCTFKGAISPVIFSNYECGEIYDANREIKGWCNEDFDDSSWKFVSELSESESSIYSKCKFRTSDCPPIRKISEKNGKEIFPHLYDFETTTSGYVRVRITGKKGARITLKYSERLKPDGQHVDNSAYLLKEKKCPSMYNTDECILDGTANKIFDRYFTIHGFRYVEVVGDYDDISLTAVICHTDMKKVSFFKCNDEMINKIHDACSNSIATCLQTFFVDNPKRDAAWVGDQMLSAQSTAILFDSFAAHYENMLMCVDALREDGLLPACVPSRANWCYNKRFLGPDWTGAVIFLVPYYVYKYTKNRKIVDIVWNAMEKSMKFFETLNNDGGYLLNNGGTGDWSQMKFWSDPNNHGANILETAMTVYYRICAVIMAELAEETGRDSSKYHVLAENIRVAYRQKYVVNGMINSEYISEYILSVYGGMLEKDEIDAAISKIVCMIKDDNMSFTFGVHGLRMVFDVLSAGGYAQTIYDVLLNDKVLGYAKTIKMGYDTVPERFNWESLPYFSNNHHFFSLPVTWIYKWIVGIKLNGFGYDNVEISPIKINGIDSFDAKMHEISVSLKNAVYTVDCPYDFTFKFGNTSTKYAKGHHEIKV